MGYKSCTPVHHHDSDLRFTFCYRLELGRTLAINERDI